MSLLASLIQAFGIKKIPPSKFSNVIESAANNTTAPMRVEAVNCYKAMYLWIGDAVETLMANLKAAQKDAAVKEFAEHKEKTLNFKRLTRTEKAKQKDGIVVEESKNEVVDVFDLAAAKEILTKFNADWIDAVPALKKWEDRRDKMIEVFT